MALKDIPIDPHLTAGEWFSHARVDILNEMTRAIGLHGLPTKDPQRGVCKLVEEVGEVATEAADAMRLGSPTDIEALERMVTELNQVAAYAILLRCSMEGVIRRVRHGS